MNQRLVIDCHELWDKVAPEQGALRAVQRWMRLHGIEPSNVPLDSEMVIEDSAYGVVIRYTTYLRNADGNLYVDPEAPEFAASEDRTALLKAAPKPQWLTTVGGEQ